MMLILQEEFSVFQNLNAQYKVLKSDKALEVEPLVSKITKGKVGNKTAAATLEQYTSRLNDTLERGDKVRHILEGELMKRQQLTKDLLWLSTWLEKSEKELSMKVTGAVEDDAVFNEVNLMLDKFYEKSLFFFYKSRSCLKFSTEMERIFLYENLGAWLKNICKMSKGIDLFSFYLYLFIYIELTQSVQA